MNKTLAEPGRLFSVMVTIKLCNIRNVLTCMILYTEVHVLSLRNSRERGDFFEQLNQND